MSSEIVIKIGGDSKDLQEEVKKVKNALNELGDAGAKAPTTANIAFGSFIGNLASQATTAALQGLANLFGSITNAAVGFAKSAEEDEKALQLLNLSLAQTGEYTKEASEGMSDYVDQLEKTSNFSGPAIAKTAAMVQQLAQLSSDALPKATQATVDFAAAMQLDIESAGKIVGKALDGNVESLGKFGIELKSTGDKVKDQAAVFAALEQFAGSAASQINNLSGAQNQLENQVDDAGKALFGQITANSVLIGSIQGVGAVFGELKKIIEENKEEISQFVTDGVLFFIDGISAAGEAIAFFVGLAGDISAFMNFIDEAILATIQTFFELQAGVGEVAINIKEFFGANTDSLKAFVNQANTSVQAFQEVRDKNDEETAALIANTEAKVEAITNFATNAEKIVRDKVTAAQLAEQEETDNYLVQLNARAEARGTASAIENEEELAKKELAMLQSEENLAFIQESLGKEAALREQARIQEIQNTGKFVAAVKQQRAVLVKAEQEQIFVVQKYEELSQKQRLANMQSTLGQIATLQNSGSKELFLIGKAAAIGMATIDGITAVQKALASAPPPYNFALAALVGVATAANVAKIASQKAPTGAFDGAMVTGGSGYKDDQPFMLSKGELVAPAKNFDQVVEGAAREKGFVKGDENDAVVNELRLLREELAGAKSITINGDILADDVYINRLADALADNSRFRNGPLAIRT